MSDMDLIGDHEPIGEMDLMLQDYRLTTAEILYHMPDYPDLLQTYMWQSLDLVPDFPKLKNFLAFWENTLDGKLHSVRIAYVGEIQPSEWRYIDFDMTMH